MPDKKLSRPGESQPPTFNNVKIDTTSNTTPDMDCALSPTSPSDPQNPMYQCKFQVTVPVRSNLQLVVVGVAWPVILISLAITIYIMYTRRKTRKELEEGQCNLPTVVWKPRFMNYNAQDDNCDGDESINWDDEDEVMEWARNFLEEQQQTANAASQQNVSNSNQSKKKKMGSSAITNILPRMERLGGPYGLYATVYGIQTKVVHVAHPIPARAILTGAGVVEVGNGIEGGDTFSISSGSSSRSNDASGSGMSFSHRRSLRMLSGSTKYPAYDHFKNFSGEGVFTANGKDWKAKRASVMHCLLRNEGATGKSLEMEANRAADSFENEVTFATKQSKKGDGSGNNDKEEGHIGTLDLSENEEVKSPVMNVVPMLQRSTIALIYRLISHHNVQFGPDASMIGKKREGKTGKSSPVPDSLAASSSSQDSSDDDSDDDVALWKVEEIKTLLPTYLDAVTRIRMIVLAQSRSFWYLLPRWVYKTFSPMYRDEERTMVPIRKFARLVCENAVPGSPLELLSQRESHSSDNSIGDDVSKDLLDEAITLLFAGQDTSAATLSWTLHLLSLHPDKQDRVAKEVRSVLGSSGTKSVTKSMTSQMPYLDAVIKESMRLYPVAPFIVRKLTSDITIPIEEELASDETESATEDSSDPSNQAELSHIKESDKTCTMPASTFACIWIYALHRNPKLWNRPNDFLPERWIDPELREQDASQKEVGAYMPFAIGPRNCLGQPVAHVVLRILLSRIVNKYVILDPKFEAMRKLSQEENVAFSFDPNCLRKDMQAGFTVLPSNGLKLQLVERKGCNIKN